MEGVDTPDDPPIINNLIWKNSQKKAAQNRRLLRKDRITNQKKMTPEKKGEKTLVNIMNDGFRDLKQTIKDLKNNYETNLLEVHEQIQKQLNQYSEQHNAIKEQLTSYMDENKRLQLKLTQAREESQQTTAKISVQQHKLEIATQENEKQKTIIKNLQSEVNTTKESLRKLGTQRQQQKSDQEVIQTTRVAMEESKSYRDILMANQTTHQQYINRPKSTIVIQPQNPKLTLRELRHKVINLTKPKEVTITKLRTDHNKLEIRCVTEEQKEILKEHLSRQDTLKECVAIEDKTPRTCKLIVPNLTKEVQTQEIIGAITNDYGITAKDITSITRNATHSNEAKDNLTFVVPRTTARQILHNKTIYVGMRPLRCLKHVKLYRCGNCHVFNDHSTEECKAETRCSWCAGRHHHARCKAETPTCFNCILWNERCEDMATPEDRIGNLAHPAHSTQCPIYLHERRHRAQTI